MNIQIGWAGLGVIIAILAHAGFTVWWASKITNEMKNLGSSLLRIDKELEKRDSQIAAAFKKIDSLHERMTRVETKFEDNG